MPAHPTLPPNVHPLLFPPRQPNLAGANYRSSNLEAVTLHFASGEEVRIELTPALLLDAKLAAQAEPEGRIALALEGHDDSMQPLQERGPATVRFLALHALLRGACNYLSWMKGELA